MIRIIRGSEFMNGLEEELGQATRAFITTKTGSKPPAPMDYGTHLRYDLGSELNIVFEGVKLPAGQVGLNTETSKLRVELAAAKLATRNAERESNEKDLTIAVLVNMLGGSVTINPDEVGNASKLDLTAYIMKNPEYLVLTTEEKK